MIPELHPYFFQYLEQQSNLDGITAASHSRTLSLDDLRNAKNAEVSDATKLKIEHYYLNKHVSSSPLVPDASSPEE